MSTAGGTRHDVADSGETLSGPTRRVSAREWWGYGVWLFVGLVFGVPESWSGVANPPWQSLSETIWHLEELWHPVAVIVVAIIVWIIYAVVRHPPAAEGYTAARPGEPGRGRTANGRLTRRAADEIRDIPVLVYFPLALGVIAAGSIITASLSGDTFVLSYVIYGLFAVFCVIIPDVAAYWFGRDVPFPTLARTVANLELRWRPATAVIVAGLVILMFHLAFAGWPVIFTQPGGPP
jgi:hypothetical protein